MSNPNWFADDAETTGTIPAVTPAVDRIDCDSCVCDPDRPGCVPTPAGDRDPVESPTAKLRAVATAVQSTLLPDDEAIAAGELARGEGVELPDAAAAVAWLSDAPPLTAGPGPLPAELSNPAFEPAVFAEPAPLGDMVASDDTAEVLHALACACPRIDDRPYHQGYDFHELGGALEARVLERHLAAQTGPAGRRALAEPAVADVPHVLPPRHAAPAERFPVEAKVKAGAWGGATATLVATVATAILGQFDLFRPLFGTSPWSAPLVLVVGAVLTSAQTIAAYQAPHSPRCEVGQ